MKVWIDQDLCTGDGLCEEIAPAVFTLLDDGLAYVKEDGQAQCEPGGSTGMATVADLLEEAVVEASERLSRISSQRDQPVAGSVSRRRSSRAWAAHTNPSVTIGLRS